MVFWVIWAVLATIMCVLLAFRNHLSFVGWVVISETPEGTLYSLEVNGAVDDIERRKFITFRVVQRESQQ